MLAIEVELLTGRYAAARYNDRNRVEWPPHPARLFSALVAAWADVAEPDPAERSALVWLEEQPPPDITCARPSKPWRDVVIHYVPGNDAAVLRDHSALYNQALAPPATPSARAKLDAKILAAATKGQGTTPDVLPAARNRQPRTYPAAVPAEALITFAWPGAEPPAEVRHALDAVLARVGRLGHSSSLVSCRLAASVEAATFVPDADGEAVVRVMAVGLLDALEAEYRRHRGCEPRALPAVLARYRDTAHDRQTGARPLLDDRWEVLELTGRKRFPLLRALELTRAVRGTLLSYFHEPIPELLSGHRPGPRGEATGPSAETHLAIVPLAFVGRAHADGEVRGVALVLPRSAPHHVRAALGQAVGRWSAANATNEGVDDGTISLTVTLGRAGRIVLTPTVDPSLDTLQARRWCRPAAAWCSVTPVVLDRMPGDLRHRRPERRDAAIAAAEATIARSCEYAGLPSPAEVEVRLDGPLAGVPGSGQFLSYRVGSPAQPRLAVHCRLWFDEPVGGPVLVGAGRHLGYGLCAPLVPPARGEMAR